jgi:hypothetical protein
MAAKLRVSPKTKQFADIGKPNIRQPESVKVGYKSDIPTRVAEIPSVNSLKCSTFLLGNFIYI